ncbi:unnamed protein product, partial [Leptidea sinapis]
MQCSASADRPPHITWLRDGQPVSSNTDPRYALGQVMRTDNSVLAQLNITRLRVEDGGLYTCVASEGSHMATHENRLDVYGPPYIRALPPIKIQSGESLNLRCPYYGYPISKIDWEHKSKTIGSNFLFESRYKRSQRARKYKRSAANIRGVLNIPEVSKDDSGAIYTCTVTSPSGEMARRAFEIQVVEAPILDDLLLGNNLQEGQIANIYCNVRTGDLPIRFEWLKDGKRIPSSLNVIERSSELFSALVIKKVSLEHCGTYTCVASNQVSTVNKSTELYIKVAPKWLMEPSNSSLLLGRHGSISCSASGYPVPQVHWMKKDAILGTWQPVLELAGGGILSLPNGTLVIEEVSLSDEGLYSCNIENGVGAPLSKTVWITVNSWYLNALTISNSVKPVHFDVSSTKVTTRVSQPVTLECHALGDQPVRVVWTHEGNVLDLHRHRLKVSEVKTTQGLVSTIKIPYTETTDAGVYQCRATNPYGAATFSITVTVLEPPTPPRDLQVESVQSRSTRVTWRDSSHVTSSHFTVQYAPAFLNDARWELATSVNFTSKENELHQSYEIENLRPGSTYAVRVATVNQVAVSRFTEPVHFTTLEEAPSSPPQHIRVSQTERPGELLVSWSSPDSESLNGRITGYNIKAVPQNIGSVVEEANTRLIKVSQQSNKQETTITFSLAPESAPTSIECTAISSTSLRVGWQPLAQGHETSLWWPELRHSVESSRWEWGHLYCCSASAWAHHQLAPSGTINTTSSPITPDIDQALSGNYTCLAKNLYGSDSVEYTVIVLPLPEAPALRATPYKDAILVEWEQPYYSTSNRTSMQKISYSLTWKEANGPWHEAWPPNEQPTVTGAQKFTLTGLKCGTKYSLRITATNKVGTSQPAYMDVSTLGGAPLPPTTNEWLWSNRSQMYIQLAGWDENGCDIRAWDVEYRTLGSRVWTRTRNTPTYTDTSWSLPLYQSPSYRANSIPIADLLPSTWYQVRVTATNEAGTEVVPPAEMFDLNMLVIIFSSILLFVCIVCCIYILVKRQRDSITIDNKSNITTNTSHSNLTVKENVMNAQNRIYSTPIPVIRNNSKHGIPTLIN